MGEFAPRNRDRKMPGWVTAWLFGVILVTGWSSVEAGSYAETLEPDYCHCDLDNYMVNVRSAVMQGKPLPPMPTSSPSTNSNSTGTSTTSTNSTTSTGGKTSTTAAPARRKRRDVAVVEIDHSLIQDVQTLMETPVDYQYSPRVKRAASTGADLAIQKDPLYSFITKQVEYSGIKTASDTGIKYDKDGKVSNCSCAPGSLVQLTICLLNEKYTNDLANQMSERFKNISTNLMYNLNIIMYQGLVSTGHAKLFRRISLKSYEKRQDDGYTDAILDVLLSMRVYQAEYHVKNAIEPSVRGGELGPFLTDAEKCVSSIAVLVVLVLFTCIGKKDAYYVRMW